METKTQGGPLIEYLNPEMSPDDFRKVVKESLTEEDERVLGPGYEEQIVNAILYPIVFAPYPATFESDALMGVVDDVASSNQQKTLDPDMDLEHTGKVIDRAQHIIGRLVDFGVIEFNEDGRCFVRSEVVAKLKPILEKFEE